MSNSSPGFRDHPEHTITVSPFEGTVTVSFEGTIIASSDNALKLQEASYPPAYYIPFKDIYFDLLSPSPTTTHCPFKGDASYWSVTTPNLAKDDVMWAYQAPFDEMSGIRDYGAFYPNKVNVEAKAG